MTLLACALAAAGTGVVVGRWWVLWAPPLVGLAWVAASGDPGAWRGDTPAVFLVLVADAALAAGVILRRWLWRVAKAGWERAS